MFILDPKGNIPLFKQLYNQVREHVLSGRLTAHSRLPSVRDLAAELSVSRNTVEGAYQELLAEGYIYSRHRSGYFVSPLDQEVVPTGHSHQACPRPRLDLQASPRTPREIRFDFHPAGLDPESFPLALWRRCFIDSLRGSQQGLARYGDPRGELELRKQIRLYLERSRGVLCGEDQVVICSGLQHALEVVCHLLRENHDAVAVENPGYHLPRAVFAGNSFRVVPVPVGAAGLDLDALRETECTLAYVTPSHQLPMGCVMPLPNRLKLIEWAQQGGGFIFEDDYDSELRYQGRPIPSLQGLRPQANIIYSGTFSKVLSPALRLSYLVLPRSLLTPYSRRYGQYMSQVSYLEQRTMASFMEQGHWTRHVRRMRTLYKKKHDAMLQAVERHFGARAAVIGAGAGLHVVLELAGDTPREAEILRAAGDNGIFIFPFSATCSDTGEGPVRLMLGFGATPVPGIEEGIALLSRLCRR